MQVFLGESHSSKALANGICFLIPKFYNFGFLFDHSFNRSPYTAPVHSSNPRKAVLLKIPRKLLDQNLFDFFFWPDFNE